MKTTLISILLICSIPAFPQAITSKQYKEDFEFFWKTIDDNYCYFNKKPIDWKGIKAIYRHEADTITTRSSFIALMEKMLNELYDHHCSLNTNTSTSRRLVPTGADIWAEYVDGKPMVTEVRKDFGAARVGVMAGMEVVAINGEPVAKATLPFLPHTNDIEARNFALRLALAGDHITRRKVTLKDGNSTKDYFPDRDSMLQENVHYTAQVESKKIGKIGYIKVNNYLFDNDMVWKFDSVLDANLDTKALIIDMRETPSGGNTTVARAILGHFVTQEQFYQKHELYAEEKETGVKRSWEEIVSPRGTPYIKPVVVLADHWTGSIAEGITTAFSSLHLATVMGTPLARLNGAIESFQMPNTKIGFNFPTERLYMVNDQPREQYMPTIKVELTGQKATADNDIILQKAVSYLESWVK